LTLLQFLFSSVAYIAGVTVAKGAYADLHKIRIKSGFGVKNKPKIRTCQSGTILFL